MDNFTPLSAAAGGFLIGLAAAILIAFNGRIAGVSGVLGGLLPPRAGDIAWRAAFLTGLVVGPWTIAILGAGPPEIRIDSPWPVLAIAGLLVGFGTRLGGGCTSGHGVCGVSRLSPRSIAATLLFLIAGVLVATFVRPWLVG